MDYDIRRDIIIIRDCRQKTVEILGRKCEILEESIEDNISIENLRAICCFIMFRNG